ncbi:MAG: AAA family ATPase [Microcoleaceae cyanobacterium]
MPTNSLPFQNYEIIDNIHVGSKTLVYRARRISNQQSVILKILRNQYPTLNELIQFKNQYNIIHNLNITGIVQPTALESESNKLILVMPDDGSISLSQYLKARYLSLTERIDMGLEVGLKLAQTLENLYQNRIIHKDIKPQNIIIQPETKVINLIDFSIASQLLQETQNIQNPSNLEGTLAYISPEQTGRMNRGIDYRTDFYSLGITLYEIFTGELLFQSNDPLEIIHYHLAKVPIPLKEKRKEIPALLSDIVMKLVAKNAEDRYQSAVGLKADLEHCLLEWKKTGIIQYFKLGKLDQLAQFNIPQKIYGRETQIKLLLDAFNRINQGSFELVLIGGYSGVGKTALVNEILRQLTQSKGYFSSGKFDQFQSNIPMEAPIKALRSVVQELLTESQERLDYWKKRFLSALGSNAQLIVNVIPELELIIGKQPPVPEIGPTEAARRFAQTFTYFTQALADAKHPHVQFIDDWQWADSATLQAYSDSLQNDDNSYSLLISAYRDNEVSPNHPFIKMVESLRQTKVKITEIKLESLQLIHLAQLVADTLHTSVEKVMPLAELLYEKTDGNPFFLTQLLKSLYENGLIWFDTLSRQWQWDWAKIKQQGVTDNVVELMISRINQLPKPTQNTLKLAACIGNQFDLQTLAITAETSIEKAAQNLWSAIQEGFIIPLSEAYKVYSYHSETDHLTLNCNCNYRFLHDRVQQAAYELIPEADKQITHYQIGHLLLAQTPPENRGDNIFELVGQLNYGINLISTQKQRNELAELNLIAVQKAKNSAAYQVAQKYCEMGISLLPQSTWKTDYKLMYTLHREAAETSYLCGDFQQAEALYSTTLAQAQTVLDKAVIYRIQMTQYQLQGRNAEAIAIQHQSLQLFGYKMPETLEKIQANLDREIKNVNQFLEKDRVESILKLPKMQDENIAEMLRTLQILFYTAWVDGQPILALLALAKMTTLSLKYGNIDLSPFGYVGYGMIANIQLKNPQIAYQFGSIAVRLCEQFDNPDVAGMTNFLFASDVHSWSRPLREADIYYEDAFQYSMMAGSWLTLSYIMMLSGSDQLTYGKNLIELHKIVQDNADFLLQIKSLENRDALLAGVLQPVRHLLGLTKTVNSFDDDDFSEAEYLEKYKNQLYHLAWFYSVKIRHTYLLNQSDDYLELISKLDIIENTIPTHAKVPSTVFYVALMHLSLVDTNHENIPDQFHWQAMISLEEKLNGWQQHSPENIQHKYLLIQAEKARIKHEKIAAIDYYEQAINQAQNQGYIYEEALGNELAAKFYLNWGKQKIARTYLMEAYRCYEHWGATVKINQLAQEYPDIFNSISKPEQGSAKILQSLNSVSSLSSQFSYSNGSNSSTSLVHFLDLVSVLKMSQAISEEIDIDKLVTKLMQMILENAGATKGVLMFNQASELMVEAVAIQGKDSPDHFNITPQKLPVTESDNILLKIVNSVQRQLKPIVVDDVLNQPEYATDPYILKQQPKSLLCLPILSAGQLLAVLYLENHLITHAFTAERMEVLKLLCSQAAISLNNAKLYHQSQNYAEQLQTSQTLLKSVLDNIPQLIFWKDKNSVFLGCNKNAAKVVGLNSPAEIVGKTDYDMPSTPEQTESYLQSDREVIKSGIAQLHIIEPHQQADGKQAWIETNKIPLRNANGEMFGILCTLEDITERKRFEDNLKNYNETLETQVKERTAQLQEAQRIAQVGNWDLNVETGQFSGSEAAYKVYGLSIEKHNQVPIEELDKYYAPKESEKLQQAMTQTILTGESFELELLMTKINGEPGYVHIKGEAVKNQQGQVTHVFGTLMNITERKQMELKLKKQTKQLKNTLKELKQTQAQVIQSEKMSSLGQMVGGVAHEINNPVNFIHANIEYAEQYSQDLLGLVELYQDYYPEVSEEIEERIEEIDLEYLQADYPKLLQSMKTGTERIRAIVLSLRNFSRLDEAELKEADINEGLESTLLIIQNRLKYSHIEVSKNYGDLPQIQCYPSQLNQVFMNILSNAIDAIEAQSQPGKISIQTEFFEKNWIKIRIADNGCGIAESKLNKIFDPFYTTKPVGKGTGLGLSVAYQIITEKHQGKLCCRSIPGQETEFIIELPIDTSWMKN